jgi:hypothetical protein
MTTREKPEEIALKAARDVGNVVSQDRYIADAIVADREALRESIARWLEDPVAQAKRREEGVRGYAGMAQKIREGAGSP